MSARLDDELAALLASPSDIAPMTAERVRLADVRAELSDRGDFDGLDGVELDEEMV